MATILIIDDGKGRLAPLTDLRAVFEVRTGALTTLERVLASVDATISGAVAPARVAPLVAERLGGVPVNTPAHTLTEAIRGDEDPPGASGPSDAVLVYNGRRVVPPPQIGDLEEGQSLVEEGTGDVIAAVLEPAAAREFVRTGALEAEPVLTLPAPALLTRPWHVRAFRDEAIALDLELLSDNPTQELPAGVTLIGDEDSVTIDPTALVYPNVTIDAEHGGVYVGPRAVIRPGAVLIGPCAVMADSTVIDRALIKAFTAIGPHCKVAGELAGTIIQGYSNKAHDGFLGDSWLGEWVNLGAGTTNSNLLNTYGEVIAKCAPDAPNERTGQTFLGAIIGDHVKTAICTRLMTGCVLHAGSMFATTAAVSGCVGAFTWATDEGRRPYRLDKFMEVARAAMARRKVTPTAAYERALAELHARATGTPA